MAIVAENYYFVKFTLKYYALIAKSFGGTINFSRLSKNSKLCQMLIIKLKGNFFRPNSVLQ